MQTFIIKSTSAVANNITLPTGTNADAGIAIGLSANNTSFDWQVINLGSVTGIVTIVANTGHTVDGNMAVPIPGVGINSSGTFRTRKTAANTYVTYRIS